MARATPKVPDLPAEIEGNPLFEDLGFHRKYRPTKFDEIVGNERAVKSLQTYLRAGKVPKAILFSGPRGCGKTTLSRCLAAELEVNDFDFKEYNSADFRGIDNARDILRKLSLKPMKSKYTVILLDECFAPGSLVRTPMGNVPIDGLRPGDSIYNINGNTIIENISKNKVFLDRVVKLTFNNRKIIFTTKDHLFLTRDGWKKAEDLNNTDCILRFCSYLMGNKLLQKELQNENGKMSLVRKTFPLFKGKALLFPKLLLSLWKQFTKNERNESFCGNKGKAESFYESVFRFPRKSSRKAKTFGKDVVKQSFEESGKYKKDARGEEGAGNSPYMDGGKRGERDIHRTSSNTGECFGVEYGSSDTHERKKRFWIPALLQSRYRKFKDKSGDRDRRKGSFQESDYISRCEENGETYETRLDNIEIYQPGNNDESFKGIITDSCKNKGFVEFYDLQIKNHPSYFVEDFVVHNCHMLTKDAQTALLKAFEEPPKHVIMILATTDPQMLIKTLIDRCVNFTVEEPEPENVARYLLRPICKKEGVEVSKEVLIRIGESCGGSYRSAVIILDGVIGLPEEERMEAIDVIANSQNETLELCQGLNKGLGCKQLMSIARNLKGEAESTRWAVLGYFSTILASNPDSPMGSNAYAVMRCFERNYFNTGKSGLLMSVYDYCFGANAENTED